MKLRKAVLLSALALGTLPGAADATMLGDDIFGCLSAPVSGGCSAPGGLWDPNNIDSSQGSGSGPVTVSGGIEFTLYTPISDQTIYADFDGAGVLTIDYAMGTDSFFSSTRIFELEFLFTDLNWMPGNNSIVSFSMLGSTMTDYQGIATAISTSYTADSIFITIGQNDLSDGASVQLTTGQTKTASFAITFAPAEVPVPAAAWLFGSGLLGLAGVARRRKH